MMPREHGAYGQLLLPLATAMAVGRPTLAAAAIAACALAAFVAHEPALVLLGRRGGRARREQGAAARRWLIASGGLAIVTGAAAVLLMAAPDRRLLAAPLAIASIALVVLLRGRERTTTGEIVVSAAFASVSLPAAVASGASPAAALTCAASFAAAFAAATVSVRAVIAHARGPSRRQRAIAVVTAALLMIAIGALTAGRVTLPAALWAASPACVVALVLAAVVPPPRYLRQIGWALVAATAVTGGILVASIR